MDKRSDLQRQTEKQILRLVRQIHTLYKKYNPHANYLALTILDNNVSINNEYWDADQDFPVNYFGGLNAN